MNWYLEVLRKYFVFEGRSHRTEYWMFFLFNLIINFVLVFLESAVNETTYLSSVYGLAVLIPSIAVGIRRLHDTGRSGWWLLIGLIPLLGAIVLLVFFAMEGDAGSNEYGPNPWGEQAAAA